MPTSYERGHPIYWNEEEGLWFYTDNNKPVNDKRKCKHCGKPATKEGYDACLGFIEGASSACCGHGVEEGYVIMNKD